MRPPQSALPVRGVVIEFSVDFVHIYGDAHQFLVFFENIDPGIEVGSAVIAMHHSYEASVGVVTMSIIS